MVIYETVALSIRSGFGLSPNRNVDFSMRHLTFLTLFSVVTSSDASGCQVRLSIDFTLLCRHYSSRYSDDDDNDDDDDDDDDDAPESHVSVSHKKVFVVFRQKAV